MADHVILLTKDGADPDRARRIIDAFAEATGLSGSPVADGTSFAIAGDEHEVPITQTLNDLDAGWADVVELGDPAGTDA